MTGLAFKAPLRYGDGHTESHMHRWPILFVLVAVPVVLAAQAPPKDSPGIVDYPGLKRFAASYLVDRRDTAFDAIELPVGKASADGKTTPVKAMDGKVSRLVYEANSLQTTTLELSRNYRSAIAAEGGQFLFECAGVACGGDGSWLREKLFDKAKMAGPNADRANCALGYGGSSFGSGITEVRFFAAKLAGTPDRYVAVLTYLIDAPYYCTSHHKFPAAIVTVIEPAAMDDGMVLLNAAEMNRAITAEGRVALYGIYFDTDLAVIKAESDKTLTEIAALLKSNATLRLLVVGHTDNTGDFERNLTLSRQRATAVVSALTTKYGIAASRLRAEGVGMAAPAASNDSDGGRAKNRRVELVKLR